jgi:hypothetical protein
MIERARLEHRSAARAIGNVAQVWREKLKGWCGVWAVFALNVAPVLLFGIGIDRTANAA